MNKFQIVAQYFEYLLRAKRMAAIHSPFLLEFVEKVTKVKDIPQVSSKIETVRKQLLSDHTILEIKDLGAGSKVSSKNRRSVASIARHSLKPKKQGQMIYHLVRFSNPKNILELGTSLGISTCYMASGNSAAQLTTIEGCPKTAERAQQVFDQLNFNNISLVNQDFDTFLPQYLDGIDTVGMVFFDGNHRKESTLNYFEQCLAKISSRSVFVFDDIRWSGEMLEAWNNIIIHPTVTLSVDLFHMGIVFFRDELSKEKVVIKF